MSIDMFGSIAKLERLLDYHQQRHNVLASNLANAETPNYKSKDLVFKDVISAAETPVVTNSRHLGGSASEISHSIIEQKTPTGIDGNGVRLEQEMAKVSANKLRYNVSVEIVKRKLGILKYAASNGGR